jgi:5-methylcytosine-specific restriction protein A
MSTSGRSSGARDDAARVALNHRPLTSYGGQVTRDGFLVEIDDAAMRRERAKARALRASQWWKRRCSAGVCHYCGQHVGAKALTMDHLVPIVRGGRSSKGNVVPACRECNAAKRHRLAYEFVDTADEDDHGAAE